MKLLSPMMRFIVSTMLIQLVLRMCGACPNGFRKSKEGKCLETTICYPGEGYRLGDGSMTNPKDTCYKCPNGTYNRGIIDTAKMAEFDDPPDVCDPIDCLCHDGTIIVNNDTCQKGEEGKICICDREHQFYGRDPLACQMMEDQSIISRIKRPGNELTNSGEVQRCQKGYFKTSGDLSICKPHTSCAAEMGLRVKVEGTATSDAVCENATDVQSTSYPPIDKIVTNNVTHPTEEEPGMPGYVSAILAVIGLLILFIITICFCAHRYPERFLCLHSLIEKIKQKCPLRRNELDTPIDEHFIPIYQDINEVVVDQSQPDDELTDSSEPNSDLPSYVRNDAFSRPGTLGNLDSCGSETSLFKPFPSPSPSPPVDTSHGGGRPIGSVAPMMQEGTNQVTRPSNLASPSEDDRGELMVSGQRARGDDEPFRTVG